MKKLILLGAILATATAYAAPGQLPAVNSVQVLSPNGNKDGTLTVNSSTVDMRGDAQWGVYATSACKFRTMSTTTKAGTQRTIPANAWLSRGGIPVTHY